MCGPIAKHNRSLSHHACFPSWCQFPDPLFMKSWQIGNWLSYDPTKPSGSLVPLYPFIYINKTSYLHFFFSYFFERYLVFTSNYHNYQTSYLENNNNKTAIYDHISLSFLKYCLGYWRVIIYIKLKCLNFG